MIKRIICILCVALTVFTISGCELMGNLSSEAGYVSESDALLEKGRLKEALLKLYEGVEALGESEILSGEINEFFSRVRFSCTAFPDAVSDEFCFVDKSYAENEYNEYRDIGIVLVDTKNEKTETIARISVLYDSSEFFPEKDDDGWASINGSNGDSFVFDVFSGPGRTSTFLYTIHSNTLATLPCGLSDFIITDRIIVCKTRIFDAADTADIYAYTWTGKPLYNKKNVWVNGFKANDPTQFIYYAEKQENAGRNVYNIYEMSLDGKETKLCYVELSKDGELYLFNDVIEWYDNYEKRTMKLSEAHNVEYGSVMSIMIEWEDADALLDIGVEVCDSSSNKATWYGNNLCYPDGTVIAIKTNYTKKQIVEIFVIDEIYDVTIDDLDYGKHMINYIGSSTLTVKRKGVVIEDDISGHMQRHYTGYHNASFTIENGKIVDYY